MLTMDNEVWLTTSETATLLGLHPGTLRNQRWRGDARLPFRRLSTNTVVYAQRDVARLAGLPTVA